MKKLLLMGALVASFASPNLYAATCTNTDTPGDDYDDTCASVMELILDNFAVIEFPVAGTDPDLSVTWDGSATGTSSDSINICIGTNGSTNIDVTAVSGNSFQVTDGTSNVAYSLDLNTTLDLTTGAVVLPNADATDLACTVTDIPLDLEFDNTVLATTPTTGVAFRDTVTITVAPQ